MRGNSKAFKLIPCATEQGIISQEQVIPAQERGISPAKIEIIAGKAFSTDNDLNTLATIVRSTCRIAIIDPNVAMILPHDAKRHRTKFPEWTIAASTPQFARTRPPH
jgi:hypothetical protein